LPPEQRRFKFVPVFTTLFVHIAACIAFLPGFISWQSILVMFVALWLTIVGVTVGYHRLLAHRSFSAPLYVERVLVALGTLACQGGPLSWVTIHRQHHHYSDQVDDPHDAGRSFWWAHTEWFLHVIPALQNQSRYTPDLQYDPFLQWLNRYFLLPQILIGAAFYFLADYYSINGGGIGMLLWLFAVRLTITYNITKLVNSAGHGWGYRNFDTPDLSTNCWWLAYLSFGEGWHNNHHAFPGSAKFGTSVSEVDLGWQHIKLLAALGLVNNIQLNPKRI
jgi:stearoyl-CoA desaturase (delta-9 desaturase)